MPKSPDGIQTPVRVETPTMAWLREHGQLLEEQL